MVQSRDQLLTRIHNDMKLRIRRILQQLLMDRLLRVVDELVGVSGSVSYFLNIKLTSSAPNPLTNSSFFPLALATTFAAPFALAIWIAKAPTEEEPPLTKTVWPGSRLPCASTARELERKRYWEGG